MSDVLCITNRGLCHRGFLEQVREIASCRPRGIVLREKDLSPEDYQSLACEVLDICRASGTECILHSHVDVALALGVRSIHLPLGLLRVMGDDAKRHFECIGASCHSVDDALEAERLGCSYITAGHVFETDCKAGVPGRGLEFLRQVCSAVSIPIYGIGGIDARNANRVREAGASGVCVMSSAMACDDVRACLGALSRADELELKPYAIFDMDGTLIDSMRYWRTLGREYLEMKGVNVEAAQETLEALSALTVSEAAALFVERLGMSGTAERIADEINGLMEGHYRNDIPLKWHVLEHLESLKSRGVRMCVASSTAEELLVSCLRRLGVLDCFEFVLSCETLGTHKREAMIYEKAASMLGASPSDVAVYEDALHALETARGAGFHTVGVYDEDSVLSGEWGEVCRVSNEVVNLE